jgi:hypothetical protein
MTSTWFKRRPAGGLEENFGIATGQRFRSTGTASIVWEVETVARFAWEPLPHVRLHRVGTQRDVKTVALETLRDHRFFQPAS